MLLFKDIYLYNILQIQTELTCQRIQELETQTSSDLELKNNKIEELTRSNEELKHQVQAQSKVRKSIQHIDIKQFLFNSHLNPGTFNVS